MKAVLVTQRFGSVHQCGKYSVFLGWVVMRTRVEMEVSMGRFMVCFKAQRAIRIL
jgi:hypothetical protein